MIDRFQLKPSTSSVPRVDGRWIMQDAGKGSEKYPIVRFATINVARFGDAKCVCHN
jgi:hypothetical protein